MTATPYPAILLATADELDETARDTEIERPDLTADLTAVAAWMRDLAASPGRFSDGYHTMDELYEYRLLYHAHAARGWHAAGIPVVRSHRHSDGSEPFGGGWFIVVAQLPTGQVSNHYPLKDWSLFHGIPEAERPPAYDGHTPHDAAQRLRAHLEIP